MEINEEFKEEMRDYIEELARVRREHIQALLIEYFERMNPDPENVVLVEEHRGIRTYWYFSNKREARIEH